MSKNSKENEQLNLLYFIFLLKSIFNLFYLIKLIRGAKSRNVYLMIFNFRALRLILEAISICEILTSSTFGIITITSREQTVLTAYNLYIIYSAKIVFIYLVGNTHSTLFIPYHSIILLLFDS